VDLGRKRIGKLVKREGRFVAEHPGALAPEPEDDQILVVAGV